MIILNYILCFIEFTLVYIFFNALLPTRNLRRIYTILIIVACAVLSFFLNDENMIIKTILNFIILFVSSWILYYGNIVIKISLILTLLYVFSIVDIISGMLLSLILGENFLAVFYASFSYRLVICLSIKVIDILVLILLYKGFNSIQHNVDSKYWVLYSMIMTVFLIITISFINIYSDYSSDNRLGLVFLILSFSFFLMSLTVIYFFIKICSNFQADKKLYILKLNFDALKEKMLLQDQISVSYNKYRHDIKKHMINACALIENGKVDTAKDLLKHISGIMDSLKLDLGIETGNDIVDAILKSKSTLCKSYNINFIYHTDDLKILNLDDIDISSLLTNLIDNAIEASVGSENPFIKVNIFKYNAYWVFCIENSYCGNKVIGKTNENLISSKKDQMRHGYGSKIIKEIAYKYNGEAIWAADGITFKSTILLKV